MKKIICFAIALLVLASLLSFSAFATEVPAEATEVTVETTEQQPEATEPQPEATEPQPETTDIPTAKSDLVTWFKETVIPKLISLITVGGVCLVYLLPGVAKMKKASGLFGSSADTIDKFVNEAAKRELAWEAEKAAFCGYVQTAMDELKAKEEESEEKIKKQMAELYQIASSFSDALRESEKHLAQTLSHVEQMSDKTERMVYIGLTNTPALAGNGAARKIAEVEEEQ